MRIRVERYDFAPSNAAAGARTDSEFFITGTLMIRIGYRTRTSKLVDHLKIRNQ